jgi:hypothetical protein
VRDIEGHYKTFRLKKDGASVEAEVEYTVRLAPGETYRPPEASVILQGGDWRQGFNAYRKWLRSWYKPAGPRPAWLRSASSARRALDAAGLKETIIYLEENPPDAAAPYYDAAFCYAIPQAKVQLSPLKLNLWRFAFPDIRIWDMLSTGIHPRVLSAEDFRLSLWHGSGVWLKGHSETWYGEELLAFIRQARQLLKRHAAAFSGTADPLVDSPHPAVFVNRFRGGGETVYTLFNASYRTVRFSFQGNQRTLGPRDVDVVAGRP